MFPNRQRQSCHLDVRKALRIVAIAVLSLADLSLSLKQDACSSASSLDEIGKIVQPMLSNGRTDDAIHCIQLKLGVIRNVKGKASKSFRSELLAYKSDVLAAVGKGEDAMQALQESIQASKANALAWLKLGNMQSERGDDEACIKSFKMAIKLRPDSPVPRNNLALALQRQGKHKQSIAVLRKALKECETNSFGRGMVLTNLGAAILQENPRESLEFAKEAFDLEETDESAALIAQALEALGQLEKALEFLQSRVSTSEKAPISAIWNTLGGILMKLNRPKDAAQAYKNGGDAGYAARLLSEHADLSEFLLGASSEYDVMTSMQGLSTRLEKLAPESDNPRSLLQLAIRASNAARRAADSSNIRVLSELGLKLYGSQQFEKAASAFSIALHRARLQNIHLPTEDQALAAELYNGLGASIEMTHKNLHTAAFCYKSAFKSMPSYFVAFFSSIHMSTRLCDWSNRTVEFNFFETLLKENTELDSSAAGPIFVLHYPVATETIKRVIKDRAQGVRNKLASEGIVEPGKWSQKHIVPACPLITTTKRFSISLLSADFNMRPVGKLVQSLPLFLSQQDVDVHLFSLEPWDSSSVVETLVMGASSAVVVKGMSSQRIATTINKAGSLVLIDLNGYTDGGRAEVTILRPACVHVNYLGYPASMGINEFDYIIGDRTVLPPELYSRNFVESLISLPFNYMVCDHAQSYPMTMSENPPVPNARTVPGKTFGYGNTTVVANFNHLQKLGPNTFNQWMRVMSNNPKVSLWLLKFPGEAEYYLSDEAQKSGVSPFRVHMTEKIATEDHLQYKRHADILADTFEYNAHVSGLDAIWAGIPFITLPGDRMARRSGASFLASLGAKELIARDENDYGDILQLLTSDSHASKLSTLRRKFESLRLTSPLYDTPAWAAQLLQSLRMAVEAVTNSAKLAHHVIVPPPNHSAQLST